MRCHRFAALAAGLVLAVPAPARAQGVTPYAAVAPSRFEPWRPPALQSGSVAAAGPMSSPRSRTRHALVGGAIGAAAGVLLCTAMSTLTNDSADGGLSFCPLDSYLLIGGGGFLLGAAVGWVL